MDRLSKHEILDVIHFYEEYIKENWIGLREKNELPTIREFYQKYYSILKTVADVTIDNNGPVDCHSFIFDETGKVPMIEFCENCPVTEDCPGELPVATLREMIEKWREYLEGDD